MRQPVRSGSRSAMIFVIAFFLSLFAQGQQSTPAAPDLADVVRRLEQQVQQLQSTVSELRAESAQYRSEVAALRQQFTGAADSGTREPEDRQQDAHATDAAARLEKLEDEYSLLTGKVNEQYQDKVESGSRYRLRLSGIVLMTMFSNQGAVDSIDLPSRALRSGGLYGEGSFGGTIRQSQITLDAFGPIWHGARTSANLQLDFAGGFPGTSDGTTLGMARLRTGTIRLDWPRTSIVAGQDAPFMSPLSPTSIAALAEPPLSYAGNLWTWIPQLRLEHRFDLSQGSSISLQGGILDAVSGELPSNAYYRLPDAGEKSRQPAYAARISWTRERDDRRTTVAVGGYFGKQYWPYDHKLNSWAVTTDWVVPITGRVELSGEFYRGRGIGGLGSAGGQSVVVLGPASDPVSRYVGLNVLGGWAQLKFRPAPLWEFNTVFGQDNPYGWQLRADNAVPNLFYPFPALRNRNWFTNFIYRPRSDLLLSLEYLRVHTFEVARDPSAGHVAATMGVLF